MNIKNIQDLLNCRILNETDPALELKYAFTSDLMSDVLMVEKENLLLITGLAILQTIRTADVADIGCIIFARGKKVSAEMIELANELGICLLESDASAFKTSGMLYLAGIKEVY